VVAHVDDTPVAVQRSQFAERLRDAGRDYSSAAARLLGPLRSQHGLAHAYLAAARLGPKVARLSALLTPDEKPRFEAAQAWNAFANLMLVEELFGLCIEGTWQLCAAAPRRSADVSIARARLSLMLAPLARQVPRSARGALARLVAARRAPSPFLVMDGAQSRVRLRKA
jgi:hypothetical protein